MVKEVNLKSVDWLILVAGSNNLAAAQSKDSKKGEEYAIDTVKIVNKKNSQESGGGRSESAGGYAPLPPRC